MMGRTIKLITVQNEYLSISGFEAYTGAWSRGGRTTRTSRTTRMSRPMNTRLRFNNGSAKQSGKYANNRFPASNAFGNGSKFTHTDNGVG
jgi:hypothetical protein